LFSLIENVLNAKGKLNINWIIRNGYFINASNVTNMHVLNAFKDHLLKSSLVINNIKWNFCLSQKKDGACYVINVKRTFNILAINAIEVILKITYYFLIDLLSTV